MVRPMQKTATKISRLSIFLIGLLFLGAGPGVLPRAIAAQVDPVSPLLAPSQLTLDEHLKKNVDFWIKINTQYSTSQGVIHDARYVDKVYEVILNAKGALPHIAKKKWRAVLLSLHKKWIKSSGTDMPTDLTPDEKHAFELFADVDEPDKFLKATQRKRLRFQLGQKDHFLDGLQQSGRYLPFMEEAFRRAGLPIELTRLPFVESSFNLNARSKVGASGIWQFMRSTGRLFLTINDSIDERNDPVRATEAAAQLLKMNYASLRSWPLAVTAYNHGRKGIMRAVVKVGSDQLNDVVANYRSRNFGFASSNFYPELLAVVEIEKNADHYFGLIHRSKAEDFIELKLPEGIKIQILTRFLKLDRNQIRELNPALSVAVLRGSLLIPAGYSLRLPLAKGQNREHAAQMFLAGYSQIPSTYKYVKAP